MHNIQILVVEDDTSLALEIEMMIAELGYTYLGNPNSSEQALEAIDAHKPDLIIMDINIKGEKNGIDVALEVANLKIPLIFITSFENDEYFQRAKSVAPAAYLIKPFHMLTLQSAIELAVMKMRGSEVTAPKKWHDNISPQGTVFIKMNKVLRKIYVNEICWIEVSGNYSYLHTKEKKHILKMSLTNILKNIHAHADFVRVHKQYVVQLKCIDSVNATENTLKVNGNSIPIGRKYKKELLDKIQYL